MKKQIEINEEKIKEINTKLKELGMPKKETCEERKALQAEWHRLTQETFYLRNPHRTPEMDAGSYQEAGGNFRQAEEEKREAEAQKVNGIAVHKTDGEQLKKMGCREKTEERPVYNSFGDFEIDWNSPTETVNYWVDKNGERLQLIIDHYIVPGDKPQSEPTTDTPQLSISTWEISEYEGTWDSAVVLADGTKKAAIDLATEADAQTWLKRILIDGETEDIAIYQKIHQPEPYCIDRLEVLNGKVIKGYVHALHAELQGDWSLLQYVGMTITEIKALGFKIGRNPDIVRMANNYQSGSTSHGLGAGHNNQNMPVQTFRAYHK